MKAPICCANTQKTATEAMTLAEAPAFGQGEVAERPMAVPKESRTNEMAAARKAPASTAPHSTKLWPCVEWPEPGGGVMMGAGRHWSCQLSPSFGLSGARRS